MPHQLLRNGPHPRQAVLPCAQVANTYRGARRRENNRWVLVAHVRDWVHQATRRAGQKDHLREVVADSRNPCEDGEHHGRRGYEMRSQGTRLEVHSGGHRPGNPEAVRRHLPPARCLHPKSEDPQVAQI